MKLGLLVLATAVTIGALASVHVSGPTTRDSSPARQASLSPAPIVATLPAVAQLPPDAEKKPYLETHREPVPLLTKARPPIEAATSDMVSISAPQPRSDITKSAARAFIEADGYKSVRVLSISQDGIWRAKALRGATEVLVTVDAQGNVSAD